MGLDARKPVLGRVAKNKAPLLFAFWKVSYLDLLLAKFQDSS